MADDYCSQNGLILYANDTVVKQEGKSTTEAFSQPLNLVNACLTTNKLTMNYEKTCLINMKARRKSSQQQLMIREKNLKQKSSQLLRNRIEKQSKFWRTN